MEILQLALQQPSLAILDETDSGLDIDALRVVAEGVNSVAGPDLGVLIITHYQRILHLVQPSHVHVMYQGRIVTRGRSGAGRPSSRPRATAGSPTSSTRPSLWPRQRSTLRDVCGRVPGPAPGVRRPPGRLPGLSRDLADAAAGDRRDDALLHRVPRLGPPRRVPAGGRGDRPVRGRARADRAVARIDAARRRSSPPTRPPRSTSSPTPGVAPNIGAGDSVRGHRDGAPLQHRPVAAGVRRARRRARVRAGAR